MTCPTPAVAAAFIALTLTSTAGVSGEATDDSLLELFGAVEATPPPPAAVDGEDPRLEAWREAMISLDVTVNWIRSDRGKVHVLVFDDADAWRRSDVTAAVGYAAADAARGSVSVAVKTLGEGPFALFAYHDENADETLNMAGGRPLEGLGYSCAVDPFLPPGFERAACVRDEASVRLNYLEQRMRR